MYHPVYSGYLADPFVWKTDDAYYAIGTGGEEAQGNSDERQWAIPLLRSTDLQHWESLGHALHHPGAELGSEIWAPEVAENQGKFYLYYSIGDCIKRGIDHQLRVAISDRPEGPYTDSGKPLLLPGDEVFVFDPHPFRDSDGQWYLFYNRNYLDREGTCHAGDAVVARRLETMTQLGKEIFSIVRPFAEWQRGPERNYNGKIIDWHTTEGACVVFRDGRYCCFYSGSAWHTSHYGVDYLWSATILGPYKNDNPGETPRVLHAKSGVLRGPGHNSLVVDPDGVTDHIVFHAWDEEMKKRQMYIEPLDWTPNSPRLRNDK